MKLPIAAFVLVALLAGCTTETGAPDPEDKDPHAGSEETSAAKGNEVPVPSVEANVRPQDVYLQYPRGSNNRP